jgi:hypothetical protein
MKVNQKEIDNMFFSYGAMTMLIVQDFLEKIEKYEICVMIQNKIKSLNDLGCDIPLKLNTKNYEDDFKQAFNRLGYSGDIAFKNNSYQVFECIGKILKIENL